MIEKIRCLIFGGPVGLSGQPDPDAPQAAAAALLVEAALIDGHFDDSERHTISRLLVDRFSLSADDVECLIADAEGKVSNSVELYGFARRAKDVFDQQQRIELIEMLWEVVYADGVVDEYESNLVRRLSGLLYVDDRDSGEARKRVATRLDMMP